jgi:hypothetical protein
MKRLVISLLMLAGTLLGCAQNHFNIPAENFAEKVQVLGIAPIFFDADSDIIHPQKELLVPLIADMNRKYESLLLRKLQNTGNYFAVTQMTDEPRQLFSSLMARRERRDDAGTQYNKYFWKNEDISAYIKAHRLDAVMVIVVSGLTKTSKIYSSNLLTSLETNFNFLTMTAQILDASGTILWEYPNFRGRLLPYYPLVNLQYPDFSESEANISRKTEVRFKSIDGIRRTLEQKKSDLLFRETQEPEVYGKLFDEMTALVKHSVQKKTTSAAVVEETQVSPLNDQQNTAETLGKPVQAAPASTPAASGTPVPVATTPAPVQAPKSAGVTPDAPNEIVPAKESTR